MEVDQCREQEVFYFPESLSEEQRIAEEESETQEKYTLTETFSSLFLVVPCESSPCFSCFC